MERPAPVRKKMSPRSFRSTLKPHRSILNLFICGCSILVVGDCDFDPPISPRGVRA